MSVRVRLSTDEVEVIDDALDALHLAVEYDVDYHDPSDHEAVAEMRRKRAVLAALADRWKGLR